MCFFLYATVLGGEEGGYLHLLPFDWKCPPSRVLNAAFSMTTIYAKFTVGDPKIYQKNCVWHTNWGEYHWHSAISQNSGHPLDGASPQKLSVMLWCRLRDWHKWQLQLSVSLGAWERMIRWTGNCPWWTNMHANVHQWTGISSRVSPCPAPCASFLLLIIHRKSPSHCVFMVC